jgi:glycosyltransferase involved in cell wall biosynthesis
MKKVLIITYYWAPSGGIGVNRCLKFAKYLLKFGWEPVIYTAENADYPYIDEENLKQVPKNITVLKKKIIEPFRFYKFLSGKKKNEAMNNPIHVRDGKRKLINNLSIWIRGNFFIPDARALWIKPSVKYLSEYLTKNHIDAILTDGPPHTNTVIAQKLSKKFNIPWLADFQDPWTQVDYYKLLKLSKPADKKHRQLEQETFKTAKKITIASPTWKKDLEAIGAKNIDVIFWGYDEEDFKTLKQNNLDKKFSIYHAGMLGFDRHPCTLLKVLADLKTEIKGFDNDLEIKFAGFVDYSVTQTINELKLNNNFTNLGTVKRTKALELTLSSQILLLLINKAENAQGRIPGKLFELMRSHRPILTLGTLNSDVHNIIEKTNIGAYFNYDDYQSIKTFITEKYKLYKQQKNIVDTTIDITEYSVENQTKKVAIYLNEIIER